MLVGRFLWKMNVRRIIWKGKNQQNFLVISTKEYAAEMVKQFSSRMYNGFNLSGLAIMDEKLDDTVIERIPVVCSKDNLLEYVQKNVIDTQTSDNISDALARSFFAADNTRIIIHFKHITLHLVLSHQFFFAFLCIHIHGTEFIHFETAAILADTLLAIENRSR